MEPKRELIYFGHHNDRRLRVEEVDWTDFAKIDEKRIIQYNRNRTRAKIYALVGKEYLLECEGELKWLKRFGEIQ